MPKEITLTETDLAAKIKAAVDKEVGSLKTKNEEILGKLTKAKTALTDAETAKAAEIEAAVQDKLVTEGKLEALIERLRDTHAKEKEDLTKQLSDSKEATLVVEGDLQELVINKGLSDAFLEAGVINPDLLEAAISLNSGKAEIGRDDNDKAVVLINGKAVDEFMTDWAAGKGKAFITDGSTGGGAGGDGTGDTDDFEQFFKPETVNLSKQLELKNTDAKRYETLSKRYADTKTLPLTAQPTFV